MPAGATAEGVGFEPTDRENPVNGFQGRRIQPLCHPSGSWSPKFDANGAQIPLRDAAVAQLGR